MFDGCFGPLSTVTKHEKQIHRRLFEQASVFDIAAEESILQMVTWPALTQLTAFNIDPSEHNATEMLLLPAVLNSLQCELKTYKRYGEEILGLCRWLEVRARAVYQHLTKKHEGHLPREQELEEESWKQAAVIQYEGSEKRGGTCSKYYARYGKKGLTGGIMAPWCMHSIAYGFHCIPVGEGHNDVFSAMVTRWPKAPEMVVYDFACALGPYCML
ncbi:hypothetical protein C8J56DRAFT_1054251 [Mycena floridula]|nr:hypothetical protein C8J56DRAFT_1054251 [Mycena floridula]